MSNEATTPERPWRWVIIGLLFLGTVINYFDRLALPSDYFPVGAVGSIAGFAGTAAGLGAVIFTFSTGWVVDHFSYPPILITAAVLAPLATGALFFLSGRVRRIEVG